MPSPSRDNGSGPGRSSYMLRNPLQADIQAPPSPRTQRTLRRLQSAHTLGASYNRGLNQPSLISQQRRDQQRNASPTRSGVPGVLGGNVRGDTTSDNSTPLPNLLSNPMSLNPTNRPGGGTAQRLPQRGRANSDVVSPLIHQTNTVTTAKRSGVRKPVFSHGHLSLQQIIRDGPTDGDFNGALESARWKVADEGVKSAEDGMVSLHSPP